MTEQAFAALVNAYFAEHLDADYWAGLSQTKKTAAIKTAETDIQAELPNGLNVGRLTVPTATEARPCTVDYVVAAIAEQALFLARNYDKQTEGRVVASQTLGELSQTFKYLTDGDPVLAPRALNQLKRAVSSISRTLKFVRG